MANNLSKNYGIPTGYDSAVAQHKMLATKLKNNEVYTFKSQNRGYLVLKKRYGSRKYRDARQIQSYANILQTSKPKGDDVLMVTKV